MKKCPKCRTFFYDSHEICSKCNIELLDAALVKGYPDLGIKESPFAWILIIISAIVVVPVGIYCFVALYGQIFLTPSYYREKYVEEYIQNIDKHSPSETADFIKGGEEYLRKMPNDEKARKLLEKLKKASGGITR